MPKPKTTKTKKPLDLESAVLRWTGWTPELLSKRFVFKVFVATCSTQGERSNDFCKTQEGEFLSWGTQCDPGSASHRVNPECGCDRKMTGITSKGETTTFRIATFRGTFLDLLRVYEPYFDCYGGGNGMARKDVLEMFVLTVQDLINTAFDYPIGTILERRDNELFVRHSIADRTKT